MAAAHKMGEGWLYENYPSFNLRHDLAGRNRVRRLGRSHPADNQRNTGNMKPWWNFKRCGSWRISGDRNQKENQ